MNRISIIALATVCASTLLGVALVGPSVVSADEAKSRRAPEASVDAKQPVRPAAAPAHEASVRAEAGGEPRRAVRIVYVGPITAR
ncbi:MAG TPA: hypothetical protein VEA41_21670 [Salinarimonas sp.]|nr:hypothetical protein [Salinarimonas sp.]